MAFASALRRAAQAQRQTRPPLGSPQQPPMQSMPVPPPMGSGPLMPRVQQQLQQQLGARPLPNLGTAPSTSPPPGSRFIFDAPLPEGMMGTMGGRGYDPVTGRLDLGTAGGSGQYLPPQPMQPMQGRQLGDEMQRYLQLQQQQRAEELQMNNQLQQQQQQVLGQIPAYGQLQTLENQFRMAGKLPGPMEQQQMAMLSQQVSSNPAFQQFQQQAQQQLQPMQNRLRQQMQQQGLGPGSQTAMQGGLGSLVGQPSMDMMYRPEGMPTASPEQRQQQEAQMRAMEQMARQGAQQPMGMGLAGLSQFGQTGTGIAGPMQAQAPQLGQQQFGGQQSPSFGNQSQAPQLGLAGGSTPQTAAPKAAGKLF